MIFDDYKVFEKRKIIVDGQNVIRHKSGKMNLKNLEVLKHWSEENGIETLILLPDYKKYRQLEDKFSGINLVNHRIHDDYAILELADKLNLPILSNDHFKDIRDSFPRYNFDYVFPFEIICEILITKFKDFFKNIDIKIEEIGVFSQQNSSFTQKQKEIV